MSEYISDSLISAIVDFDPVAEKARAAKDGEGYTCRRCKNPMHIDLSEVEPSALCHGCSYVVLDELAKEAQIRRRNVEQRALEVAPPRQRNVRYRGGRR